MFSYTRLPYALFHYHHDYTVFIQKHFEPGFLFPFFFNFYVLSETLDTQQRSCRKFHAYSPILFLRVHVTIIRRAKDVYIWDEKLLNFDRGKDDTVFYYEMRGKVEIRAMTRITDFCVFLSYLTLTGIIVPNKLTVQYVDLTSISEGCLQL